MRNTIVFNLNDFDCDCLAAVNDGTNVIAIEARKSGFSSPYIAFSLADGTTREESLQQNGGIVGYEIPAEYYSTEGTVTFRIKDGIYSSPEIIIIGAENPSGNNLTLKMESSAKFVCKIATVVQSGEFGDEWKEIIEKNAASRHDHSNKNVLDNIESIITNSDLEKLLT